MHHAIYHNTHPEFVIRRKQLFGDEPGLAYKYAALIIEMITDENTTAGALAAGPTTTRSGNNIVTEILGILSDVPGAGSNLLTTFETYIRRNIISDDINSSCFIKPPDCGHSAAALAMYAKCEFVIGNENHRVIDSKLALKMICSGHVRGMRVLGKEIKHQPPTTPPQDVMDAVLLRRRFHDMV